MRRQQSPCITGLPLGDAVFGGIVGYLWAWVATVLLFSILSPMVHFSPISVERNFFDLDVMLSGLFIGLMLAMFLKKYYPIWTLAFAVGILLGFGAVVTADLSFG